MTWNPRKKNFLTIKPSSIPQVCSKAEERDLELIFNKLQHVEESTRKIYKETKKYEDEISSLNKVEQKVASDLSNSPLCYQNAELRQLVEEYYSVSSQVGNSVQDLVKVSHKTVVEPMKKFGGEFSGVQGALNKREQVIQEYMRLQARLKKAEEKERTATNIVKMEQARQALKDAHGELSTVNAQLLSELPQFHEKRIDYFQPILQALIRSQVEYYGNTTRLFTHLVSSAGQKGRLVPGQQYEEDIQNKLSLIRSLSIVRQDRTSTIKE